jgi:hypothetical protein
MGIKLLTKGLLGKEVASVNANAYPPNLIINNQLSIGNLTTRAGSPTVYLFFPFRTELRFRPSSVSIDVTSTTNGGAGHLFFLKTPRNSASYFPTEQVFYTPLNTNIGGLQSFTQVLKSEPISLNSLVIEPDTLYWWAINYSGTIRAIPLANTKPLGKVTATTFGNHYSGNALAGNTNINADSFSDLASNILLANGTIPSIEFFTATI